MRKNVFLVLVLLGCTISIFAQTDKRALTVEDIVKWNRITQTLISDDGQYIAYQLKPWKGDPTLKLSTKQGEEILSVPCASINGFTASSDFLIYTIHPAQDTIKHLKLKKEKKENFPQDKLVVFNLKTQKNNIFKDLKSVQIPQKWNGWIAFQVTDSTSKEGTKSYSLSIYNLHKQNLQTFPKVTEYHFAKEAKSLVFASKGDSTFDAGVYHFDLQSNAIQKLSSQEKTEQLTIHKNGNKVAFLASTSPKDSTESWSLFAWTGSDSAHVILNNEASFLNKNWEISKNGTLRFSDSGNRLFLGTAPILPLPDTTQLEEDKPKLDIWVWNEERLHTEQLKNLKKDLKKSYLAVFDFSTQRALQIETPDFTEITTTRDGDGETALAWSNRPYAIRSMWEGYPLINDFYLINLNTGETRRIKKAVRATPRLSPAGKFIYWYNAKDTTWHSYQIATGKEFILSEAGTIQAADELNDVPNFPDPYGSAGWLENDEALLVYDRYDMWQLSPIAAQPPINLTSNGRATKISYRLIRFNPEPGKSISPKEKLLLFGHNEISREDAYYDFKLASSDEPRPLLKGAFKLNTPIKAKNGKTLVFTKENFNTYPNLWASTLTFQSFRQISDAAPQQKEFNWGTAELISWTSLDGLKLEGMLFKPENFDPNKKYPLIVNFYEKSSQRLLSYRIPEPHRSTIDYHYYTSNGYVIFNPDVYYKEGYPGESAFNCVMPGINKVLELGFVDKERIAAQGHSWGGYQVAYLATRTNLFAAIESGAPVVNMFSAYGGIRWGSGKNRSFQYEHTQSRIGKSIWEAPLRYLENSPLFTLDKIQTPILIMHNDDDGAVPWYQGIEFFIGMRRLGKPCWLLNYNDADHWPMRMADRYDFQIRLAQFFDHYLKDAPMPVWMKKGIPATHKETNLGYELEND